MWCISIVILSLISKCLISYGNFFKLISLLLWHHSLSTSLLSGQLDVSGAFCIFRLILYFTWNQPFLQGGVVSFSRIQFSSIHLPSHFQLFVTPWTAACQASLSITNNWVCSNLCILSWWCHPTTSSSVTLFSSCPQSFLASESFPVSQLFTSGGQNIGASALASVLPMNVQGWFPLGLTDFLSPWSPQDSQESSPAS